MKIILSISLMAVLFVVMHVSGVRFNFTNSVDFTVFIIDEKVTPKKGDYVSICQSEGEYLTLAKERQYLSFSLLCEGNVQPLIKPIVAVEGDVVEVSDLVRVNNVPVLNSKPNNVDSKGLPLPVAYKKVTVASGNVWLVSSHSEQSWDSRYYGGLSKNNILGVVKPIF